MSLNLLKQAEKLGVLEFSIHPFDKRKVILNDEGTKDITEKWEELEKWVNSKVKVNINISLDKNLKPNLKKTK